MNKKLTEFETLVIDYRTQGKGYGEIAKLTGKTKHYIGDVCRKCGVNGELAKRKFDDPVEYIRRYTNELEYVSGWTNCDGRAKLRCKKCGTEFELSMKTIRLKQGRCPMCLAQKAEAKRKQKQIEAEQKLYQKQIEKQQQFWLKDFKQAAFKICPVCGSLFTGGRIYCSEQCRNQNKWNLKDGYRYQFPLKEVYKRDEGVCWLCGGLCDWNDIKIINGVAVYGNRYPSRDHVVPKSKGGKNTWTNIRLAHRGCNSIKSNHDIRTVLQNASVG